MDKSTLENLKADSQRRFNDLSMERDTHKTNYDNAVTELARIQGDYRTYDSLLANWVEPVSESDIPASVPTTGSFSGLDDFDPNNVIDIKEENK